MATHDYVISNASGASVRADLNNALAAIVSNNSNATSPATTYAYQWWADTTTGQLKLRNSANSAWITIFELDGTMLMEDGSASAPGLAFASDLNTGFFRSAADKINFATGGAERLEIGSSEVVFNDPSNDVDFRVESNGNANMLFVDAGNDRIGIGTNSPDDVFDVRSGAAGFAQFVHSSGNGGIRISGSAASSAANLVFSNDHTNGVSDEYTIQMSGDNDRLTFRSGGPGDTERVTFTAEGKVGIGTSSPAHAVHVAGATTPELIVEDTTNNVKAVVGADNTVGRIGTDTNHDLTLRTNDTERLRIDSSGRLLVGTSTARTDFYSGALDADIQVEDSSYCAYSAYVTNGNAAFIFGRGNPASGSVVGNLSWMADDGTDEVEAARISAQIDGTPGSNDMPGRLVFSTTADNASSITERVRIDSSGRVGIGTSSPVGLVEIEGDASYDRSQGLIIQGGPVANQQAIYGTANDLVFDVAATERVRIDSSGRLLVGLSSSRGVGAVGNHHVQIEGAGYAASSFSIVNNENNFQPAYMAFGKSRGTAVGANTSVASGDTLGVIEFCGADGTDLRTAAARVSVEVDGTPGSNDMPGRLIFSTTADGGTIPTQRAMITQQGEFYVGVNNPTGNSYVFAKVDGNTCFIADRLSSDGNLFLFRQAGTQEGSISVSGTTVSYNGGHISRWSQLAGGAERTEILRGSVMSNLDEMCEWAYEAQDAVLYTEDDELPEGASVGDVKEPARAAGTEDNEQLNRMKVSDVEGDVNVSGVFQAWDDDDDTYDNDFYCAMTGDFVIRIAQGTTVARGDLLMSAGDGTAKPQDDDIVRSKTIAKVTSTTVSTTYSDGSYCVPCVLMAC